MDAVDLGCWLIIRLPRLGIISSDPAFQGRFWDCLLLPYLSTGTGVHSQCRSLENCNRTLVLSLNSCTTLLL